MKRLTLVLLVFAAGAWTQGLATWVGQSFYLRGFSSSNSIEADAAGHFLSPVEPGPWTLAQVHITQVDTGHGRIVIQARRLAQVYDRATRGFNPMPLPRDAGAVTIRVHADAKSLDPDAIARLRDGLFLRDAAELSADLPPEWAAFASGHPRRKPRGPGSATPPHALRQDDPEYSDAARLIRLSGSGTYCISITAQGTVGDVSVVTPIGAGLDEMAIAALRAWTFSPARDASGLPIPTVADVGMNFRLGGRMR